MQLRFTSLAVINLRRDLHPQECAHAGRTQKTNPGVEAGVCQFGRVPNYFGDRVRIHFTSFLASASLMATLFGGIARPLT